MGMRGEGSGFGVQEMGVGYEICVAQLLNTLNLLSSQTSASEFFYLVDVAGELLGEGVG
jgi:hypothetical protein